MTDDHVHPPIPATQAEFFWNSEPGQLPTDFVVANKSERMAQSGDSRRRDPYGHLQCSDGAHCDDWLQPDGQTPEAVFASVFLDDLPPKYRGVIVRGLRQFVLIEGQEWAQRMLKRLLAYGDETARRAIRADGDEPVEPSVDQDRGRVDFLMLRDLASSLGQSHQQALERMVGYLDDESRSDLRHQLQFHSTGDASVRLVAAALDAVELFR